MVRSPPSVSDSESPQLACVVLSFANQPRLPAAVASLLAQGVPAEIIVVNSGGGDPAASLRAAGIDVPVVNRRLPVFPGGARNIGIRSTRAPYVSFLSADSIAEAGWIERRLNRHRAGAAAVSSAVTNAQPHNLWAWASHVLLFARRMPGVSVDRALHYGVSYHRTLFERFGLFREDLRTGEDSDFNDRLFGKVPIVWAPEVCTGHVHPETAAGVLGEHYARGQRMARTLERLTGRPHASSVAFDACTRWLASVRIAWRAARSGERRYVLGATPLMPPAVAAYALGALRSNHRRRSDASPIGPPRVLALLAFHNEMRFLPDYFRNVAPQVDGIVALDDGSTDGSGDFVSSQSSVLELVRLAPRSPHAWDEPRNRRLLVDAAMPHGADWLIAVDADERLERGFRQRAAVQIARAEREDLFAWGVTFRELWNDPACYRVDGMWGKKNQARLFKARADHEFDPRALHGHWAPLNSRPANGFLVADLIIYHLRMIDRHDRLARRDRYRELDPDKRWQPMGYDYLTSEDGLELHQLPWGREYEPLPRKLV
jgi:glycosyltransferase involved in cell wall biosynthesis